jgi:hypothetical protein
MRSAPAIIPRAKAIDWSFAVDALRIGDDEGVARALALFESNEVEEVEDPPNRPPSPAEQPKVIDLSDRCWRDDIGDVWMTDFPPPEGFNGYESRPYDDIGDEEPYERACTDEEAAILEADYAGDRAAERAEDAELRDLWFTYLEGELPRPQEQAPDDCEAASESQQASDTGSPTGEPR